MTVAAETPSQVKLDEAQAKLVEAQAAAAKASAQFSEQQAQQLEIQNKDSQYSALVPDLTKVGVGTLDTSNDKVGMAGALAFRAMNDAAAAIARDLERLLTNSTPARLLLTNKPDLLSGASARLDVPEELRQLNERASAALTQHSAAEGEHIEGVVGAIAAAASALPGVLSLFAKHEVLSSSAVAADDLAATASVAGALLGLNPTPTIFHDTFQLSRRGSLYKKADELASKLIRLQSLDGDAAKSAKELTTLITNTLTAIASVPKGGSLSALAAADVWDVLTKGLEPITHVLLLTSETGSTTQLFDQRLVVQDKVLLAATAGITYMLIDMNSAVRASGTRCATVQLHGKVDEVLEQSVIE